MFTPPNHDVWQRGALGPSAWDVYLILQNSNEALRQADIARATGRNRKTVKDALQRLEKVQLVCNDGGIFWSANSVCIEKLDEIADMLGTNGKLDNRKKQHQRERERFADLKFSGWIK